MSDVASLAEGGFRRRQEVERGAGGGGVDLGGDVGHRYFVYGTPGADGQDKLLDGWKDRALV